MRMFTLLGAHLRSMVSLLRTKSCMNSLRNLLIHPSRLITLHNFRKVQYEMATHYYFRNLSPWLRKNIPHYQTGQKATNDSRKARCEIFQEIDKLDAEARNKILKPGQEEDWFRIIDDLEDARVKSWNRKPRGHSDFAIKKKRRYGRTLEELSSQIRAEIAMDPESTKKSLLSVNKTNNAKLRTMAKKRYKQGLEENQSKLHEEQLELQKESRMRIGLEEQRRKVDQATEAVRENRVHQVRLRGGRWPDVMSDEELVEALDRLEEWREFCSEGDVLKEKEKTERACLENLKEQWKAWEAAKQAREQTDVPMDKA